MMLRNVVNRSRFSKGFAVLFFLSIVLLVQGCGHHRRTASVASHKVTLERHGITNRFGVEERDQLAIFRYDGYSLSGGRLKVRIENDKVVVNDKEVGVLNKGDAVHVGNDGITVNSLDYGQTEKYLQANQKQETAQRL